MLVAVTAGTPVDTELGTFLVKQNGFDVLSYPVANSPKEQDRLQFLGKDYLEEKVKNIIDDALESGAEALFIYCNSLSTAIDYKKISKEKNFKIITPLEVYEKYALGYNNIALIAANSQSAHGIENILKRKNSNLNLISIGMLPVVVEIEAKREPKQIIEDLGLKTLFKFFEETNFGSDKVEGVILGCTHFPYLKDELEKITKLKILDPAEEMLNELKSISK